MRKRKEREEEEKGEGVRGEEGERLRGRRRRGREEEGGSGRNISEQKIQKKLTDNIKIIIMILISHQLQVRKFAHRIFSHPCTCDLQWQLGRDRPCQGTAARLVSGWRSTRTEYKATGGCM